MNLQKLNTEFQDLSVAERIGALYSHFAEEEILVTSSFGANSAYLLHHISRIRPTQPIHFIDTQYHFPETLAYKSALTTRLGLHVIDITPENTEHNLTEEESWWIEHPRMCCTINKVAPLNRIKDRYRVWISGLMAFQTPFRSGLQFFEEEKQIIRFHPMIDLEEGQFLYEYGLYQLPQHPLVQQGYTSIGCTHCTVAASGRGGRWAGKNHTECGIHTNGIQPQQEIRYANS